MPLLSTHTSTPLVMRTAFVRMCACVNTPSHIAVCCIPNMSWTTCVGDVAVLDTYRKPSALNLPNTAFKSCNHTIYAHESGSTCPLFPWMTLTATQVHQMCQASLWHHAIMVPVHEHKHKLSLILSLTHTAAQMPSATVKSGKHTACVHYSDSTHLFCSWMRQ